MGDGEGMESVRSAQTAMSSPRATDTVRIGCSASTPGVDFLFVLMKAIASVFGHDLRDVVLADRPIAVGTLEDE